MFGSLKKRLAREMSSYCVLIQLAAFNKFVLDYSPQLGRDEAGLLAAAVANRLFGMPKSPGNKTISTEQVDGIARGFVKTQHASVLFRGILLSLRTAAALATDENDTASQQRIREAIQWLAEIVPLPPDAPNPAVMKALATDLTQAYPTQS